MQVGEKATVILQLEEGAVVLITEGAVVDEDAFELALEGGLWKLL